MSQKHFIAGFAAGLAEEMGSEKKAAMDAKCKKKNRKSKGRKAYSK